MWGLARWTLVAVASTGCIHDRLVACGDVVCPVGNGCDLERSICIDPVGLSVPPANIAFTDVACGGSGQQVLEVRNFSSGPIAFSAVSTLDGIDVVPPSGVFPAGATVTLQLIGNAPPRSVPGTPLQGAVLLAVDGEVITRDVELTTTGAVVTASVQQLDFGEATVGLSDTRAIQLHNTGNAAIQVAPRLPASQGPSFTLATPPTVSVGPGETTSIAVAFQPQALTSYASSLTLDYTGNTCEPPPTQVSLSGTATTDDILLDHLTLDFGEAACDGSTGSLPLKLTNNLLTDQALTMAISGTDASLFTSLTTTTLQRGPGGTLTFPVGRPRLTPATKVGGKSATLTIDAPGPPSTTKEVNLSLKVSAPVLSSSESYFDFGIVPKNSITSHMFVIANVGNALATLKATPSVFTFGGGGKLVTSLPTIQPDGTAIVTVTLIAGNALVGLADSGFTYSAPGMCSDPIAVVTDFVIQ